MGNKRLLIMSILVFAFACSKRQALANSGESHDIPESEKKKSLVIAVNEPTKDIKIPAQIFKLAEGDAKLATGGFSFFPVKVILTEKNAGVLKEPEIIFEMPKGGGRIDLSPYMGNVPGSFYLRFEFDSDKSDQVSIFFVSESKKRKIENEVWGMGCNRFADVTKYVMANAKMGIKLNTTKKRHLAVMGGSFIFSLNDGKRMSMSHVTFEDSGLAELFCENKGS